MQKVFIALLCLFTVLLGSSVNSQAIEVSNLYFPHVASDGNWETEIGIINTGATTLEGVLHAYNSIGVEVEVKNLTLASGARSELTVGADFDSPTHISYITFQYSSAASCSGYEKFYIADQRVAIPAVSITNSDTIYISHIASNANWWTGLALVNTTDDAKTLTFTFSDGSQQPLTLTSKQHWSGTIAGSFPQVDAANIESATITNASGIIGLELFGSTDNSGSHYLSGILLTDQTSNTLYYSHVASDDNWWTGIVSYNPTAATTITITPFTTTGHAISTSSIEITAGGKYIGTVAGLNLPEGTAWFKVDATNPITGFELFGQKDGSQLAGYSAVNIKTKQGTFVKTDKEGWTGIAFVNTENETATVNLAALDDNGVIIASTSKELVGNGKQVNLAEAFFAPADITAASYIKFSSDRYLVGFQLNSSADSMMLDGLSGAAASLSPVAEHSRSIPSQQSDIPVDLTFESDQAAIDGMIFELKDITGIALDSGEEGLTESLVQLSFPDDIQKRTVTVTIDASVVPDMILAQREGADSVVLLPFIVNSDGTATFQASTDETLSFIPVVSDSHRTTKRTAELQHYDNCDDVPVYFKIIENSDSKLTIQSEIADVNYVKWQASNGKTGESYLLISEPYTIVNPSSGIYTFELIHKKAGFDRTHWSQNVFVSNNIGLSTTKMAQLAEQFAPILALNDNEKYYPSSLNYLFNQETPSPDLAGEKILFALPWATDIGTVSYSAAPAALSLWGHKKSFLDIKAGAAYDSVQATRTGSLRNSVMYYSFIKSETNHDIYYLNYHMFYSFDPKMGTSADQHDFAHVFDRESMTVKLKKTGEDYTAEQIIYSGHLDEQIMMLMDGTGVSSSSWGGGRVAEFTGSGVETYDGHPIAAIALGSHAIYPTCGMYRVVTKIAGIPSASMSEPAGGSGSKSSLSADTAIWNNVLMPPSLLTDGVKYKLKPLNLQDITSDFESNTKDNFYLAYSGAVVDVKIASNAPFPPFTTREINPKDWVDDAPSWASTFFYPTYVSRTMGSLYNHLDVQSGKQSLSWYKDNDDDGYGIEWDSKVSYIKPIGYVAKKCNFPWGVTSDMRINNPNCKQNWDLYNFYKFGVSFLNADHKLLMSKVDGIFSVNNQRSTVVKAIETSLEAVSLMSAVSGGIENATNELTDMVFNNLTRYLDHDSAALQATFEFKQALSSVVFAALSEADPNPYSLALSIAPKVGDLVFSYAEIFVIDHLLEEAHSISIATEYLTEYYNYGSDETAVAIHFSGDRSASLETVVTAVASSLSYTNRITNDYNLENTIRIIEEYRNIQIPKLTRFSMADGSGDIYDCNDYNKDVYPSATEIFDGIDNNCDGVVDEGFTTTTYYRDVDGDNYGDPNVTIQDISLPDGYVENNTDCNDEDSTIHPNASDIPDDGIDQDCNGGDEELGIPNVFLLLDNSGSMSFPVYEKDIDYGAMYDFLFENTTIADTVSGGVDYYGSHYPIEKIYLLKGRMNPIIINVDGYDQIVNSDSADPEYLWYLNESVDTNTYIDHLGNLSGNGNIQRITTDNQGHLLLDGVRLPLGQDILLNEYVARYDGTMINTGFGGRMNGAGTYCSGFEAVGDSVSEHDTVEDGDDVYLFVTGNWMNMQQVFNLHYITNPGAVANIGDPVWNYEQFLGYRMQNRLDVSKAAILDIMDEFENSINWGFATFSYEGTAGDGALIHVPLNIALDYETNREQVLSAMNGTVPKYGTPIGEALQDVFEKGYYGLRNSLDNHAYCKNYVLVISDGAPSGDDDWARIGGVTFDDFDGDGFTADPYQYSIPPANYYDDVAHWIYTHSWRDKSVVTDPINSYENIISHQISFGSNQLLMSNAANESGSEYFVPYNKAQLIDSLHSLGVLLSR